MPKKGIPISYLDDRYVNVTGDTMTGNLYMQSDAISILFGTGNDASIGYDGTNLVINPKVVGSGSLVIGSVEPNSSEADVIFPSTAGGIIGLERVDDTVADGNRIGDFRWYGGENSAGSAVGMIRCFADDNWTATSSPTAFAFVTTPTGSSNITASDYVVVVRDGGLYIPSDSRKLFIGAANDASIYYDATNLVINPQEAGTGFVDIQGNLRVKPDTAEEGTPTYSAASVANFQRNYVNNANAFISICSGTQNQAGILLGDYGNTSIGRIYYNNPTGEMTVNAGNVESFKITNSGITIGSGRTGIDYTLVFDGEDNDCILTWMEDEDYLNIDSKVVLPAGLNVSGLQYNSTTVTTTYTVLSSDVVVAGNSTTDFTITLPAATGSDSIYYITNINTGTVTVEGDGTDTIAGDLNTEVYQWETILVHDIAAGTWAVL